MLSELFDGGNQSPYFEDYLQNKQWLPTKKETGNISVENEETDILQFSRSKLFES